MCVHAKVNRVLHPCQQEVSVRDFNTLICFFPYVKIIVDTMFDLNLCQQILGYSG